MIFIRCLLLLLFVIAKTLRPKQSHRCFIEIASPQSGLAMTMLYGNPNSNNLRIRIGMNLRMRILCLLSSVFCLLSSVFSQINHGTITYERKTNLYKKYKDWKNVSDWIKESDKSKVDFFVLHFNDSLSCFKPQDSNLKDQTDWTTSKNTVYQNFKTRRRLSVKEIMREQIYVEDSLFIRKWKITDSKRNIGGYSCRKAIWQVNDSMRIYAWYCDEIMVSTGPESFYGLPGAILGIATEDGGVIYFAKTIELSKPGQELLLPQKIKKKIYTTPELQAKLEKDFGKEKWSKALLYETFDVW